MDGFGGAGVPLGGLFFIVFSLFFQGASLEGLGAHFGGILGQKSTKSAPKTPPVVKKCDFSEIASRTVFYGVWRGSGKLEKTKIRKK